MPPSFLPTAAKHMGSPFSGWEGGCVASKLGPRVAKSCGNRAAQAMAAAPSGESWAWPGQGTPPAARLALRVSRQLGLKGCLAHGGHGAQGRSAGQGALPAE